MFIESYRYLMLNDNSSSVTRYSGLPKGDRKLAKGRGISSGRKTKTTTQQLLPSHEKSRNTERSILHKEVHNENINIRVLLLSPWPGDAPPYSKSIIDLYSRFGSISTEMIKLPGAENHFFRLYVTSCEENVRILLPAEFRGAISVESCSGGRIKYSTDCSVRIKKGLIRINATDIADHEDEVHIHALGTVEIRLVDSRDGYTRQPIWYSSHGRKNGMRRLRRWLKVPC